MSAHSRFAPSSAYRWVECPGSVPLGEQFPQLSEHPAGPEGTAAHWVWEAYRESRVWPKLGDIAPNGIAVTDDMLDGANDMIDRIMSIAGPHGIELGDPRIRSEQRVAIPSVHSQAFGTPDWEIDLLELVGEYHLLDFKFGHRPVGAFENWQCVMYLRGVCDRLKLTYDQVMNAKFVIHVVQPRCFHGNRYEKWETTGAYLAGKMWPELKEAAYRISDQEMGAPRTVGSWCRDCPGRRACPTLKHNAGAAMDWMDHSYPYQMTAEEAGHELVFVEQMLEQLQAHATGIRAQVEHDIEQGRPNNYFAMLPSSAGTLKWNQPFADVIAMGDLLDVNLRKAEAPLTPTQAIKELKKKGFDDSVISEYSERVPGSLSLKPINYDVATRIFSND